MSSPALHLATGPLRAARARIIEKLVHIAERVGSLEPETVEAQRSGMREIVADLAATLTPHLLWEERVVHPLVDKYACEGPAAFSASMRYEHEIIYRWIGELRDLTDGDAAAFARRADNVLGVVLAHFELEEHVLFPILDRYVNAAVFSVNLAEGSLPSPQ